MPPVHSAEANAGSLHSPLQHGPSLAVSAEASKASKAFEGVQSPTRSEPSPTRSSPAESESAQPKAKTRNPGWARLEAPCGTVALIKFASRIVLVKVHQEKKNRNQKKMTLINREYYS
jgi:hypothetical protein